MSDRLFRGRAAPRETLGPEHVKIDVSVGKTLLRLDRHYMDGDQRNTIASVISESESRDEYIGIAIR